MRCYLEEGRGIQRRLILRLQCFGYRWECYCRQGGEVIRVDPQSKPLLGDEAHSLFSLCFNHLSFVPLTYRLSTCLSLHFQNSHCANHYTLDPQSLADKMRQRNTLGVWSQTELGLNPCSVSVSWNEFLTSPNFISCITSLRERNNTCAKSTWQVVLQG